MELFSKKIIRLFLGVAGLFVIDRASKWLAINVLPEEGFFIIPDITGFILERNQGIAYGIPLSPVFLIIIVSIIIFILFFLLVRAVQKHELESLAALSLIIIGAFSNLLDRIRFEYVIDLMVLTSWPVFNLSDIFILAGVMWLIISYWQRQRLLNKAK
ncbi:signal peptidase II [Patescibacteria group bacterium]|nr:signal peptidase II [Patescibacteria group bacterium]